MQELFIKAVTAPDDSRDIMHYETYYYGITEIFSNRYDAEDYLCGLVDEEITRQLNKLEYAYYHDEADSVKMLYNTNLLTLIKRKVEIKKKQALAVMAEIRRETI